MSLESSRVDIPGTTNLRDLGGYPAKGGALEIKPRRLFRSELLVAGDKAQRRHLRKLQLNTVIDLRADYERAQTPSVFGEATGATVVDLPLAEGGEGTDTTYLRKLLSSEMPRFAAADMAQFYRDMLDNHATTFAAAVRLLAEPGILPALVHCAAGKDRTGVLIALVLDLLGVPREVIVGDYTLTGVFRPDRVEAYAALFRNAGIDLEAVRVLFETPATAMEATLDHLGTAYGGALRYLVDAGDLEPDAADLLTQELLMSHPQHPNERTP